MCMQLKVLCFWLILVWLAWQGAPLAFCLCLGHQVVHAPGAVYELWSWHVFCDPCCPDDLCGNTLSYSNHNHQDYHHDRMHLEHHLQMDLHFSELLNHYHNVTKYKYFNSDKIADLPSARTADTNKNPTCDAIMIHYRIKYCLVSVLLTRYKLQPQVVLRWLVSNVIVDFDNGTVLRSTPYLSEDDIVLSE